MTRLLAIAVTVLLAGCGSTSTTFHTLSPVPPARPGSAASSCGAQPIMVERVGIPGILDRNGLVSETRPGRLVISGDHAWAGPLSEMTRRVLAEDLRARLGPDAVLAPGDPSPQSGARGLQVNILRFMPGPDGSVALQADWSLMDRDGAPRLTRSDSISEPGGGDPDGAVMAMSQTLAGLSDHIASALPGACSVSGSPTRR